MADDSGSWLWAIATIGGPLILALALAYAVLRTRPWRHMRTRRRGRETPPVDEDRRDREQKPETR